MFLQQNTSQYNKKLTTNTKNIKKNPKDYVDPTPTKKKEKPDREYILYLL